MQKKCTKNKLALFFTMGISIKTWAEIGSIEREVAIYNKLSNYFDEIYFFTYGNEEDLKFEKYLEKNIRIIPKKYISNDILYSLFMPLIHYKIFKHISIIKTNQMWGSWSAVLAKWIFRSKLIVRTGYMLSINFKKENPKSRMNFIIKLIEKIAYRNADSIITTSKSCIPFIENRYSPRTTPVQIPNYIDTDLFKPLNLVKKKNSICFIGRLSREKNLFNLLKAIKGLDCSLTIVGSGDLYEDLKNFSDKNQLNVDFLGNVKNSELPKILNQHEIFVLPSFYEGMPKAILEAMACGLAVIGTNVSGINEVIDSENGILCNTDYYSLKIAITELCDNRELLYFYGKNAENTILKNYSLEKIVLNEIDVFGNF